MELRLELDPSAWRKVSAPRCVLGLPVVLQAERGQDGAVRVWVAPRPGWPLTFPLVCSVQLDLLWPGQGQGAPEALARAGMLLQEGPTCEAALPADDPRLQGGQACARALITPGPLS